jgi:dienelactone hydrolase
VKIDGVSYGSKASYQHHPAWFAREGYCCLILDTLQLGEIEGLHHGTYREGMWWWPARGYTPAGVEAWNAVRALDYLETRPEVDMKNIGVTGRSGGGAYTWWLAGIDDRPACLIPVAGITDLENHVVDGCIEGHCDCMYMVNTYGWDFPTLAALAAPRPLLLSNSDKDSIFPLDGVVRTHAKLKKIYELYGAKDKLGLLITEGPHKDTQELQVPAFRWMNRWLQHRDTPITRVADKPLDPKQLKVFDELPPDQRNTVIHETFVSKAAPPPLPKNRAEWELLREQWLADLQKKSFRGWPQLPPPLDPKRAFERQINDLQLQVIEYTSDENLQLPIYLVRGARHKNPYQIRVVVADGDLWKDWLADVGFAFGEVIPGAASVDANESNFKRTVDNLNQFSLMHAVVPPRGSCLNEWNPDKKEDTHFQRRFALSGKSADEGRVWDVCRAVEAIKSLDEFKESNVFLLGNGRSAGIALYAGLFSPDVERIDLLKPTSSHRDGPFFLNVLRVLDMPQAAALAFPKQVFLYDADAADWRWTDAIAKFYSTEDGIMRFSVLTTTKGQ